MEDARDLRSPGRRSALRWVGRTVGTIAAGGVAAAGAACVAPLVDPRAVTRIPLEEVPEGRRMILHADRRVELVRNGASITARLMICTHEFCDLTWYQPEDNYRCTCHAGKFSADGRPKSGPVTKRMFELPARIDGETLIVGPAGELSLTG